MTGSRILYWRPAGAVLLLLEAAVADFAKAVEEHSSGERVAPPGLTTRSARTSPFQ